jgi:hypothetical protein
VVEREPQLEQQPPLEYSARDAGVADRAEQDRVVTAQLLEHRVGQRLAGRVPTPGAEVVRRALDLHVGAVEHGVEHLEALVDHLGTDAVTGDDREVDAAGHGRSG